MSKEELNALRKNMKTVKALLSAVIIISLTFCASSQKKTDLENETNPQYQYDKAEVAFRYGLEDEALKYINQALSLNPDHKKSYNLLGMIQLKKGNFEEAALAYEKFLEFEPNSPNALFSLGSAYQQLGHMDKAEENYKKAYTLDSSFNLTFKLAELYFQQNKIDLALEYTNKAIQMNKNSAPAFNLQGVIYNQLKRYPDAVKSLQNALWLSPDDVIASINLGVAYINNTEYDKAQELFEKTLPKVKDQALKDRIIGFIKKLKEFRQRV